MLNSSDFIMGMGSTSKDNCDKCNKKQVCKYQDQYKKLINTVSNIDKGVLTPFEVSTRCTQFAEDKVMRDGFWCQSSNVD